MDLLILDFLKIVNGSSSKDTVDRMKTQVTDWVKILVIHTSDKILIDYIKKKTLKTQQ